MRLLVRRRRWWVCGRQKTTRPSRDVGLHPIGELRVGFGVASNQFGKPGAGRVGVVRAENGPDVGCDFLVAAIEDGDRRKR